MRPENAGRPRAQPARRLFALALAALLAPAVPALGQVTAPTPPPVGGTGNPQTTATPKPASLPSEFRGIKLGMSLEEVQSLLQKDSIFDYRGPDDVSLLPTRNESLVEASGTSFVKRAFFQFYEGKLWVIIAFLNPDKIDHYSVYSAMTAKYGEPASLSPKEALWEDKATRMALERPLTLRWMDMAVFSKLQEGSAAEAGATEIERRDFLGGL